MKKFRLNIDGMEVIGLPGQTILDVARENDIYIPTFCFDERMEIYGSCGLCVVEVEGNPKLLKSCATEIAPNMIIKTDTERVTESRKTNLELLLTNHVGDCVAPCKLACPAHTDCQGYVGLTANGQYAEALQLVKESIPLPSSIGRVCPHPCEDQCRRKLVDDPISIAHIKSLVGDLDLESGDPYMPEIAEPTGKSLAIIGGGPYGLSLAYFMVQLGHDVTIFEAMPKLGGMLRYGIPEYRLPNNILDAEIAIIEELGVEMIPNTRIGVDIDFETIRQDFDAVAIGVGAWISTGVGCEGEDAGGVIGGIDLLRKVVRNEAVDIGKNVAVVGGGNTAMDACRTAVRLGADNVYNIYRRTKAEMPADEIEIVEATEEGVVFKNLTNPMEINKDKDGHVKSMKLQVMELGEPDESGRRAPIPVEGQTETIEVDTVILAIGQAVDSKLFKGLDKTRKKGIVYDKETFMTSIPGVFAGGDCGNDKISIAIESIADAKKSVDVIDGYLMGEEVKFEKPFFVERDDITEKTFEDRERMCRVGMEVLTAEERKGNFTEIVTGYTPEEGSVEGDRCLECGCGDFHECKLIDYSNEYKVEPDRFAGDVLRTELEDNHPFIIRDPDKCILCGLCVRICDEVMGISALGLVERGFDTVVKPTLEKPLVESGCVSCGQCVSVCPVGALQERLTMPKSIPLDTDVVNTTCPYCSVGCSIELESYGDMLVKAVPDKEGLVNKGLLCGKGKFGFDCSELEGKITSPMMKTDEGLKETNYYDAFVMTAKKAQSITARYGQGSVAVAISDRYTNEEAYAMKRLAETIGAKQLCFNNRESGLKDVLGVEGSPNTIDELLSTDLIVAFAFETKANPVIQLKLKQAAEAGVKVILINPKGMKQSHFNFADEIYIDDDLEFMKEISAAIIDSGQVDKNIKGYNELANSLKNVKVSERAKEIAKTYMDAKKAMIVFQQNIVSKDAATLIGDIALLSGHIGSPRDGILQVKAKNNSQGLIDMGITAGAEAMEGVRALLLFGEDPGQEYVKDLDFLMVSDTHLTETGALADVFIPGTGFASVDGTFTNTERRLNQVQQAICEDVAFSNWEIAREIAAVYEIDFLWEDTADISLEMEDVFPGYRYSGIGDIAGGVLPVSDPKFVEVDNVKLVDVLKITDNLMNTIIERLPVPVNPNEC